MTTFPSTSRTRTERTTTGVGAPRATPLAVTRILASPSGIKRPGNPYLRLLYDGMRRHGAQVEAFSYARALRRRYDVVHLHWPEKLVRARHPLVSLVKHARLAAVLATARLRGSRIVWTCHNLRAHEGDSPLSEWLFRTWFVRVVTQTIALSPTGRSLALETFPALRRKPGAVIPHGHYRPIFTRSDDVVAARRALGVPGDAYVFLSFGSIRPYKNVPALLAAFRALAAPHARLIIAGEPATTQLREMITALAAADPRVVLRLGVVPDADVPALFAAADRVVCPFTEILNSGSVMLGLSLNRPVLAPRAGALPDLQAQTGERWLRLYDGAFTSETLGAAMRAEPPADLAAGPDLSAFDWEPIAAATYSFYAGET